MNNQQNEEIEAAQEQPPPAYEDPPDYEEASSIKFDMTMEPPSTSTLEMRRQRRKSRSRSRSRYVWKLLAFLPATMHLLNGFFSCCIGWLCRSHSRQFEVNSLINLDASTPAPSEVLIPDLYLTDQAALSETSVIECAIASRNTRKSKAMPEKFSEKTDSLSFIRLFYSCIWNQVVILNRRQCIHGEVVKFYWYQIVRRPNTHHGTHISSNYSRTQVRFPSISLKSYVIWFFLHLICRRKLQEQPTSILDQPTDTDANQLGMTTACRTSEAWIMASFVCLYTVFPFLQLS